MKKLERIVPTVWINNQAELSDVVGIFNEQGIKNLRVNCTRSAALEYINEIIGFQKKWGNMFELILDMPIPKKKVRVFYEWQGNEFEIQKDVIYSISSKEALVAGNTELYVADSDFNNLINIPIGEVITIGENQAVVKMERKTQSAVWVKGICNGIVPYGKYITTPQMKYVECSHIYIDDYVKIIEKISCYGIALSFIENAKEIKKIRNIIGKDIHIIAKIETMKGVENIEEIIEECDEIMIARGDLFINTGYKFFAKACNKLISICERRKKKYYIATGVFESFCPSNVLPSRSEICEFYNVFNYTNASIILEHNKCRTKPQTERLFEIINDMVDTRL